MKCIKVHDTCCILCKYMYHNGHNIYYWVTPWFLHALSTWLSRASIATDFYLAKSVMMLAIKNGWKNDVSHYANLDLHSVVGKNHTNSKFRTIQICTKQGLTVSKVTVLEKSMKGQIFKLFPAKKLASNQGPR